MTSSYVLDSSSLFTLFFLDSEEGMQKILKESYVLDLTGYEIGSILTKGNGGHIKGLEREFILDLTIPERILRFSHKKTFRTGRG